MKTSAQVLDEAIAHLEKEGMWCQNAWVKTEGGLMSQGGFDFVDKPETIIGLCAEGAIRLAAGVYHARHDMVKHEDDEGHPLLDEARATAQEAGLQSLVIEEKVAKRLSEIRPDLYGPGPYASLNSLNDSSGMRASDIILAMKQVREDLDR